MRQKLTPAKTSHSPTARRSHPPAGILSGKTGCLERGIAGVKTAGAIAGATLRTVTGVLRVALRSKTRTGRISSTASTLHQSKWRVAALFRGK
jgi:hypothetical protein